MSGDPLIERLRAADADGYAALLGALYERSPFIARAAFDSAPHPDRAALHAAMRAVVDRAGVAAQLALIRAHPDLAGKLARAGGLDAHSAGEQRGLGLDRLPDALFERFDRLNRAYRERFGFPFVIAVRAQTREGVLSAFEHRLGNDPDTERRTALDEIHRIAWFRLQDL